MAMKWTVSNLAKRLCISPVEVNSELEDLGLQRKVVVEPGPGMAQGKGVRHKWEAIGEGLTLSSIVKGNKGETVFEMLVWDPSLLDRLGYVKPPSRADYEAVTARLSEAERKIEKLCALLSVE